MDTRHPRILYFSQHWPHKAGSASELRSYHVRRALEHIGDVEVVVLEVEGGGEDWVAKPDNGFTIAQVVTAKELPNKTIGQKLKWIFDPRSFYAQGRAIDGEATGRILQHIERCDLIWFSKIRTASMIARWAWPRSVLDIDDVPSTFETAVLQSECSLRERALTMVRRWSWRRREKLLGDRFTTLAVCSEQDRRYLRNLGVHTPTHVIANGSERPSEEPVRRPATPPRIGFVGLFDYHPNVEGIEWFVKKCWPRIKREVPEARLRLAGRSSDGPLKPEGQDVDGLGWIEDIGAEMASWSVMVVPVLVGAGTRGKIALGFSRKCPIVSTSLGAYGYDIQDGAEIFLADGAESFADACLRLIRRPEEAAKMAERANRRFLENWTWEAIQPRIWAAAEDCLRRSGGGLLRTSTPCSQSR